MPVAKLTVPTTPGDYDIRYVLDMGSARTIKATAPITVSAVAASLTVPPKAESAEPFTVAWTGPAGQPDYIDIVPATVTTPDSEVTYAWAREGSPAKLTAPGKAGAYLVRYVQDGTGGRKILSTAALQVTQPAATLNAPDSAAKGAKIKVDWTGPKRKNDYVDLVKKGQAETSGELSYFYTDRSSTSELNAPSEAGQYDIRYVLEAPGGRVVLATRTISVR
jgi:Ca-activated chloride channel family protein